MEDNSTTSSPFNVTEGDDGYDRCYYEQPAMINERFWLVTVTGSTISFISIVENVLLFYLFLSRKHHRTNHNMYMMLLAFFDVFVSAAYICLMSVNVLSDYLVSPLLVQIWFFYMVPMITISHIGMTSSSFLIVAASFERYCVTVNSSQLAFAQRNRKLIAGFAVLMGVISKGSICLEFEISNYPECAGLMTEYQIGYREFVFATSYHVVWRFWYRNFVTIFAPFFILAYFNMRIVKALTAQQKMTVCAQLAGNAAVEIAKRKSVPNYANYEEEATLKRKVLARAATRSLVLVVCCYLVSNIINVILTIWEHVDKESLLVDWINVYAIAIDMVSLLTTLACAFRLPILMACQLQIRREMMDIICSIFRCQRRKTIDESERLVNSGGSSQTYAHPDKENNERERSREQPKEVTYRIPCPESNHTIVLRVSDEEMSKHISINDDIRIYYPKGGETLL